ncbi:hypothetical protein TURU_001237 [Turdus rufiventris]|nr:hypothetical protein TURU_001237 [Turdus rufiventris]
MEKALSKEERATLNVLQLILPKRAVKDEPELFKRVLGWGQERGCSVNTRSVLETLEWERLGINLWDAVSDGSEETKGLRNGIYKVVKGYGYSQPQDGKKEEKVTNRKIYCAVGRGSMSE